MRNAYRTEKFSELCEVCRVPTGHRCFHCEMPLCEEHAHLSCVACARPAAMACKRCGQGMCTGHLPKSRRHRCPACEEELWELAGRVSATNAPATAGDAAVIGGLFAGSVWSISIPPLAVALAAGAVAWPGGKMIYIGVKRRAKAEQLRPEFIREKSAPKAACWDG